MILCIFKDKKSIYATFKGKYLINGGSFFRLLPGSLFTIVSLVRSIWYRKNSQWWYLKAIAISHLNECFCLHCWFLRITGKMLQIHRLRIGCLVFVIMFHQMRGYLRNYSHSILFFLLYWNSGPLKFFNFSEGFISRFWKVFFVNIVLDHYFAKRGV